MRTAALVLTTGAVVVGMVFVVWGEIAQSEHDVAESLAYLGPTLADGAAHDAQASFPEGYLFSYALFGLASADAAAEGDLDESAARQNGRLALDAMRSDDGTAPFDAELEPAYGIFHAAWTLLLEARLAGLAGDDDARAEVGEQSDEIAAAFEASLDGGGSPFLAAYPGQSWPVDSVVAIAALRTADEVTGDHHDALIDRWLERADELVDPRTGLLPHRTDPSTGELVEGTRGTSQSIIQRMWPIVSPETARESYRSFRRQFVDTRLGFVGVVEYPQGVDGEGDVDSGPLVLGFSASATVVTIGAARANGDGRLAFDLEQEADSFGLPITSGGERRYAFGLLPIGDAFLTWSKATPFPSEVEYGSLAVWWAFPPMIGLVVVAVLWGRRGWRRFGPPRDAPTEGDPHPAGSPLG